jgi:DNA-binding NarL/FixJ family response regulator
MGNRSTHGFSKKSNSLNGKLLNAESQPGSNLFTDVCIINDREIIREGLLTLLKKNPNVSKIDLFSREQFSANKPATGYHIILSEIEFQSKLDPDFIRHIRDRFPPAKIIIYTLAKNMKFRKLSLNAGADFFIFIEDRYNLLEHLVAGLIQQIKFKVRNHEHK